jgi:starch synthase
MGMQVVFTIHNMGYQGIFGPEVLPAIGFDLSMFTPATLEFWGNVNFMKAALIWSDSITTVSPSYAQEIQTPEEGFGLDGLLRSRASVITGILNGVDYRVWSPDVDKYIAAPYDAESLEGKAACKRAVMEELGIDAFHADTPLLGIVSRFATQKGFDLIEQTAGALMAEDVSLAVLGSAASADEARYEQLFRDLQAAYPGRVGVKIGYDNGLAHRIEAGSDIFLMPSRYEPCGLNQMYSLRYGTPPVVRATGGLNDTIDETVGFKFHGYAATEFLAAVRAAIANFQHRDRWTGLMRRGMARDYSWAASAEEYSRLYNSLGGTPRV